MTSVRKSVSRELKRVVFRSERTMRVKELRGFQKHFSIPDRVSPRATAFVRDLASDEMRAALDQIQNQIRQAFGYKRRQLASYTDGGCVGVTTPHFTFQIRLDLHPEDPAQAIWASEIVDITDPEVAVSEAFESVFGDSFHAIEYELDQPIVIADLIDELEDLAQDQDQQAFRLEYPADYAYCELAIRDAGFKLRVEPTRVIVSFSRRQSPKILVASLRSARGLMLVPGFAPG